MKIVGKVIDMPGEFEDLKQLLSFECTSVVSPRILDELLKSGEVRMLDTYEEMIDAGVYDPNIYIVRRGLVRGTYLDGNIERTAGFALPGTLLISFHSYYGGEPSFYRFEACCHTEVIKIPREYFNGLLEKYHDFALWIMSTHQNQLYYNECKNRMLSGDAKTKLKQLTQNISGKHIKSTLEDIYATANMETDHNLKVKSELYTRWHDIFRLVPSKIIASYLGITEQHLSKIKRELLMDEAKRK